MLALACVLASACIAFAGVGGGASQQMGRDTDRGIGNGQGLNSGGAMRVDEDLYPFHYNDINQFGDDEAYNSSTGHNNMKVPFIIHREDH
jgi:hypothetical protein